MTSLRRSEQIISSRTPRTMKPRLPERESWRAGAHYSARSASNGREHRDALGVGNKVLTRELRGRGFRHLPARKDQNGRMTIQGRGKNLRAFHTKIDATVFDAGDSRLRDATQSGQLALAKTLKLTNNANGLAGRTSTRFLAGLKLRTHSRLTS